MGFRFQKRVSLFPGVRINFSPSGISTTIGVRGASVNLGSKGACLNLGIPGSGLSYRTRLDQPPKGAEPTLNVIKLEDVKVFIEQHGD